MVSARRTATALSLLLGSSALIGSSQAAFGQGSPPPTTPSAVCKDAVCLAHHSLSHEKASQLLELTGPIEATECDFEALDSVGSELFQQLHELVETPFFRYFRVSDVHHSGGTCLMTSSGGPVS